MIPSAHGSEEITAMCIDQSGRRLITASRLGQAKGWDVTTGELMQTFIAASPCETTSLVPLTKNSLLISAGWAKDIVAYKDRPEKASLLLIVSMIYHWVLLGKQACASIRRNYYMLYKQLNWGEIYSLLSPINLLQSKLFS